MRYGLIITTIIGAAALFAAAPAQASAGLAVSAPHAALHAQSDVQPVYWVWRGHRYRHRTWAPRRYYRHRWANGHWRYY